VNGFSFTAVRVFAPHRISNSPAIASRRASMAKPSKPKRPVGAGRGGSTDWMRIAMVGVCLTLFAIFVFASNLGGIAGPASGPTASRRRASDEGSCEATEPEMCEAWHKGRMCRSHLDECRRTCGGCPGDPGRVPKVSAAAVCRRDNLSASMPKGHLNVMFERLMTDFPQHRPVAISRDPWVVQLHDVISDDETEAFISSCDGHFERSLAGDQLNPVRASSWELDSEVLLSRPVELKVRLP